MKKKNVYLILIIVIAGIILLYSVKKYLFKNKVNINDKTVLYMSAYSSWLQYALDYDGWNLWLQSGDRVKCITKGGFYSQPCWSPDKDMLAFCSYRKTKPDNCLDYRCLNFFIWVMSPDGKIEYSITPPNLSSQCPDWSGDGEKIVFQAVPFRPDIKKEQNYSLYITDPVGAEINKLELNDSVSFQQPCFAPDNQRVVAIGTDVQGTGLYIIDIITLTYIEVYSADDKSFISSPDWHPTNQDLITFINNGNIQIIDLETSKITQLTSDGWCEEPSWASDGTVILFTRMKNNTTEQIFKIDISTGQEEKITNLKGSCVFPIGH